MIADDFRSIALGMKDDRPPTRDEIKRFMDVYDSAMGCYPTPGTDMWRVRQWLLNQAA